VRADIRTTVTLDTVLRIPYRDIYCNTTLLISRGAAGCGTVYVILECGYGQAVTFLCVYLCLNVIYEVYNVAAAILSMCEVQSLVSCILPALRNSNLNNLLSACVDSVTLSAIGSLCSSLHQLDSLLLRNDVRQLEECRLQNGVDTSAQSDLLTNLDTINYIELDVVVCDKALYLARQMLLDSFHIPRAVQQEGTAVYQLLYHVVLTYIGRIVACYEVCLVNQVCRLNLLPKRRWDMVTPPDFLES